VGKPTSVVHVSACNDLDAGMLEILPHSDATDHWECLFTGGQQEPWLDRANAQVHLVWPSGQLATQWFMDPVGGSVNKSKI